MATASNTITTRDRVMCHGEQCIQHYRLNTDHRGADTGTWGQIGIWSACDGDREEHSDAFEWPIVVKVHPGVDDAVLVRQLRTLADAVEKDTL